jgi:hypothetical protein
MATADTSGAGSSAGLGDELKQDAAKLGNVAGERLSSEAESHKGEIASQARSVSSALEKAAGELGGQETPDWLRSSLQQGAETLQRLADSVENKNPRELLDDFNALGRDHPGAFLGACALAGFAVARVFKAGSAGAPASTGSYGLTSGQNSSASDAWSAGNSQVGDYRGATPGSASTSRSTGGFGQSSAGSPYGGGASSDPALATTYSQGAV